MNARGTENALRRISGSVFRVFGRTRMIRRFRFVPLFVLLAARADAAPVMPMGFERLHSDDSGRTWRETGRIRQPLAMAKATVRTSMRGQGYSLVHDIASDNKRSLQFWRRTDEDVILVLWQEDLRTTGVAWGLSNRDGDNRTETPKPAGSSSSVDKTPFEIRSGNPGNPERRKPETEQNKGSEP